MKLVGICLILLFVAYSLLAVVESASASEGIVSGHVYDTEIIQPLSGAWVYCQEVKSQKEITDSLGYYAIKGGFTPSKTYTIECIKHGYNLSKNNVTTNQQGSAEANFFIESVSSKAATQDQIQNKGENLTRNQIPTESSAACMAGSWLFELTDNITRKLDLSLIQDGNNVYGTGILNSGDNSLEVAASGTVEGNKINLEITSLGMVSHYRLALSINGHYGDSVLGDYRADSPRGESWNPHPAGRSLRI
jgi:hypothetical protein